MILHVFLPQTTHRKPFFTFQLVDHDKRAITSIVSSHTQVVEKYTVIFSISIYKPQSLILKFVLQGTTPQQLRQLFLLNSIWIFFCRNCVDLIINYQWVA